MSKSEIVKIEGRVVPVSGNDIDTDEIIPARYMRTITFSELGEFAFYDARFDSRGGEKKHPFNDTRFEGASIMAVNKNFGCGSSREHAPQALMRHGIKAIIGESFAEIFAANCQMLGILCVTLSKEKIAELQGLAEKNHGENALLDLNSKKISFAKKEFGFEVPEERRRSLMNGNWDTLGLLLANEEKIREKAGELPYLNGFS